MAAPAIAVKVGAEQVATLTSLAKPKMTAVAMAKLLIWIELMVAPVSANMDGKVTVAMAR